MAPSLDRIHEVEEWSQRLLGIEEKDSLWEVQVAIILESFSFASESQARCRRALELDPRNWRASYYLAHATASNSEAIQTLEAIVKRFETDNDLIGKRRLQKSLTEILFDLGQRYWGVGQFDQAIHYHIRSVKTHYAGGDRALVIMEQYRSQQRWFDIVNLLNTIQKEPTGNPQNLADMMMKLAAHESLHEILLQTAIETGQFDFLERIYESAINTAVKRQVCTSLYYLRYYYANAVYQQPENEERAIGLWELALKDDLPRTVLEVENILPDLTRKLAPLYLRRARAAERDSDVARSYLERISSILPDETSENNIVFPAKLYLARYYHAQGDKLRAKQIARSVVKMALEILSDGDYDNDYLAYWRLLLVFLPLEDDKNARAAVVMAGLGGDQKPEDSPEEQRTVFDSSKRTASPTSMPIAREGEVQKLTKTSESRKHRRSTRRDTEVLNRKYNIPGKSSIDNYSSTKKENQQQQQQLQQRLQELQEEEQQASHSHSRPIFAVCDANCGYGWTTASEMWWCRDCINLTFDRDCYQRLKNGTLQMNICDRGHDFLYIPKWDTERMKRVPGLCVPYGDRIISLDEWKREIWREYVEIDVPVGRRMSRCFF